MRSKDATVFFLMPRAKAARGKVRGALPRSPARGTPPETPGRLSLLLHLAERSSPSRVRFAAQTPRAIDRSGPFRRVLWEKRKAAKANPPSCSFPRLPLVGPETIIKSSTERRPGVGSLRSLLQAHSSIRKCYPRAIAGQISIAGLQRKRLGCGSLIAHTDPPIRCPREFCF